MYGLLDVFICYHSVFSLHYHSSGDLLLRPFSFGEKEKGSLLLDYFRGFIVNTIGGKLPRENLWEWGKKAHLLKKNVDFPFPSKLLAWEF